MGVDIAFEPVQVDIADPAHHRGRAHGPVFLPSFDEGEPGARGDVAIAGGIDYDLGQDRLPAGLIIDDDAFNLVVPDQRFGHHGVQQHVRARLEQHVHRGQLVGFDVPGHDITQARTVLRREPHEKFPRESGQLACRHDNQPHGGSGCGAAEESSALDQQRLGSGPGGRDRGRDARHPAAADENVDVAEYGNRLVRNAQVRLRYLVHLVSSVIHAASCLRRPAIGAAVRR